MLMLSLNVPEPSEVHCDPVVARQVHVIWRRLLESAVVISTPASPLMPTLLTVSVQRMLWPGSTDESPSVTVTEMSAGGSCSTSGRDCACDAPAASAAAPSIT